MSSSTESDPERSGRGCPASRSTPASGKQADALVVTKVDRLARSVVAAADIMQAAQQQGWSLIILDLGMDLSTPSGKAMAQMLAVFAELERERERGSPLARRRDSPQLAPRARGSVARPPSRPTSVAASSSLGRPVRASADRSRSHC
jgi:hypothetical protein